MPDAGRGDDVERPRPGQHEVQLGERLDRAAEPASRPPDSLGDRLELAVVRRQQGQHPVCLAQLEPAQNDGFGVVNARLRHLPSLRVGGISRRGNTR